MGISIYARWRGQTAAEETAQLNAFYDLSTQDGDIGYLHEMQDGELYATHVLVPEAIHAEDADGVSIPVATLRERLPEALRVAREQQRLVYNEPADSKKTEAVLQSLRDFVALCERKEQETGEPCSILAVY